jgi:UDP-N-acetylmuramate dehydrogenase
LILTDIYAASESPIEGVTINTISDKVKASGFNDVEIMDKKEVPDHLLKTARPGDMVLVLGAGDIKKVADETEAGLRCAALSAELKKRLKGVIRESEPMSHRTSFRIGGPARIWIEPEDAADLRRVLSLAEVHGVGVFIIGNGTNLLVRDGGVNRAVVSLGSPAFCRVSFKGTTVKVGAGFGLPRLVSVCCGKGLGGLESLVGIPGSVGGAIYMNAGGWTNPVFKNMSDLVASITVMDRLGAVKKMRRRDIEFGYRSSGLKGNIILEAELRLARADRKALLAGSLQFMKMKKEKQVLDMPSAGCVFKNPPAANFTCGQMIDMLGLKGCRVGRAEISRKHANFIVNRGGATCEDVLELAKTIKGKVKENYGIELEMEVEVV